MKKKIAAIVTEYRKWSHAEVILDKIFEGYYYDRKEFPSLELVSLFVDQFHKGDRSKDLAKKHGFTIYDSIQKAVCRGGDKLAVEGVISIGEHGQYAKNERGQILYPRRRFFEEIATVFERSGKSVPVFNDKHLAATWADAKWMYDRANALHVPFMAGSSVPVTWRKPDLTLKRGCEIESAVQVGYGPFEGYGFHALEALQCMVERRKGGETGVKAVTCVQGEEMWKSLDRGEWSKESLEAALERVPSHAKGDYREPMKKDKESGVFLIEYRDGFRAAVAMMNGWVYEGDGGAFCFGAKIKGDAKPVSTQFYLQQPDPFGHFAWLLKGIDHLIQTNHAPYPVERTLLTTGILDAVMISKSERNRRVETPHLDIRYEPTDWPHATGDLPKPVKRS